MERRLFMKKLVKDFIFFPDVTIMLFILLTSLTFTAFHLTKMGVWIALLLGMATYMVMEYLTHRFLFHINPPKNPILLKLIKRLHYDHHADPNDLKLLFLPLWYSIPNLAIGAIIVYFITTDFVITNSFLTGLIIFFLFYEWKHYVAHRPIKPLSPWGKWMKKHHLLHHFKNENYWFGVTTPTYDFLLGTFKNQKKVEKSATARNLEKRDEYKNNPLDF